MIISIDTSPHNNLYLIGSKILETLNEEPMGVIDLNVLFRKTNIHEVREISFSQFLYTLDWLYLIDAVKLNGIDKIERCF